MISEVISEVISNWKPRRVDCLIQKCTLRCPESTALVILWPKCGTYLPSPPTSKGAVTWSRELDAEIKGVSVHLKG